MAKLSDVTKLDIANKLSIGIVSTNTDKNYFEEQFAWHPIVVAKEIWADEVPIARTQSDADIIASSTGGVVQKFDMVTLEEAPLSNGQGWVLYDSTTDKNRIIDWINPHHFGDGYFPQLFENDGTPISITDSRYQIDAKNGIVRFEEGFTPNDLGMLTPLLLTVYVYVGRKGIVHPRMVQHELIPQNIGLTEGDTVLNDTLDFTPIDSSSVLLIHNKIVQVQGVGRDYTLTGTDNRSVLWQPKDGGSGTARPLEDTDELYVIYWTND